MKDSIVFILELPLKIYVFGHIYLLWVNRLYPALHKHKGYLNAKRDVAARGKVHLTSKSNLPNLEQHLIMSNSNSPFWKSCLFMPISHIPVLKLHFCKLKSVFAAVLGPSLLKPGTGYTYIRKSTIQHQKVFLYHQPFLHDQFFNHVK